MLGLLILGLLLLAWEQNINWAALVLAFFCGYVLRVGALLLAASIGLLWGEFHEGTFVLSFAVEALLYFIAYRLIPFRNGIVYIHDFEIKSIIFLSAGIVLSIVGVFHLTFNQVREVNPPLFFALILSLLFLILGLAALILFLSKKHRQLRELAAEREELIAKNHKYKDVIPAFEALMEKLEVLEGDEGYRTTLREMAAELSAEFQREDMADSMNAFHLPESWQALELRIAQIAKECGDLGITVSLQNSAPKDAWADLSISQIELIRLVGNLLSNAKKELYKADVDLKHLSLLFREKNHSFSLEVHDTAPPFSISVLPGLGKRGNSTNGTGDGYAEIFEILEKYEASLTIIEMIHRGKCTKRVKVSFDGKSRIVFQTNSRFDEVRRVLRGTSIHAEAL